MIMDLVQVRFSLIYSKMDDWNILSVILLQSSADSQGCCGRNAEFWTVHRFIFEVNEMLMHLDVKHSISRLPNVISAVSAGGFSSDFQHLKRYNFCV